MGKELGTLPIYPRPSGPPSRVNREENSRPFSHLLGLKNPMFSVGKGVNRKMGKIGTSAKRTRGRANTRESFPIFSEAWSGAEALRWLETPFTEDELAAIRGQPRAPLTINRIPTFATKRAHARDRKWPPAATLAFILVTCGGFWLAVAVALGKAL